MKKNRLFKFVIVFMLLVQVANQFGYNIVQANSSKIVQELEIVNPKEQYFPGDNVVLRGTWRLEDDNENKEYKAGDTFSISIPEGMTPNFKEINLSGYGKGTVVGNEVVFTFTENVEQEINRNGGFNLMFTVDKPVEEAIVSKPIEIVDNHNNSLLKETIIINNEKYEVGEHTGSIFHKGSYGYDVNYPEGLSWFININSARTLEAGIYTFEDRTHENHIIDFDSIDIRVQNGEITEVGESDFSIPIIPHEDQRGFTVNLNIVEKWFEETLKTTYFDIYYRTIYIGEHTEEPIQLKNTATLTSQDNQRIPMDHKQDNEPTVGDYQLGGWGTGTRVKGNFKLIKLDEVTQKPLENARFNLIGKYDQMRYELVTDESGVAIVRDIPNGPYILEELEAPEGFLLGESVEFIINNKNGEEFTFTYTNKPKLKEISVQKIWQDHKGNIIDAEQNIIIQLLANGEVIKQGRLNKGDDILVFSRLLPYDSEGNNINYEIKEIMLDGFSNTIKPGNSTDFVITNIKDEPEPVEPVDPEPVEPVEPEPVEPVDPEPVEPVDPEPVEPVDPEPVEPVDPEPVEPVDPEPVEPVDPGPVEPVDPKPVEPPVEVEEVLGGSANLGKVPVADVLPNTGQHNNGVIYFSMILVGILLKRKND